MKYYNPLTHHVHLDNETGFTELLRNSDHYVAMLGPPPNLMLEPKIPFRLVDIAEKSPDKTGYIRLGESIVINVEEYGTYCEGHEGEPIFIENYEGELRVALWTDINQEDCTHSVSMEGARLNRETMTKA